MQKTTIFFLLISFCSFSQGNHISLAPIEFEKTIKSTNPLHLIDLRTKGEFEAGHIDGAANIPVDEIRDRLNEIPAGKRIDIYCEAGLRGYLASRILRQNGFNEVFNLSGGYVLWNACTRETALPKPEYQVAATV